MKMTLCSQKPGPGQQSPGPSWGRGPGGTSCSQGDSAGANKRLNHFSGILKRGILKSSFQLLLKPVLWMGAESEEKTIKGRAESAHPSSGSGLAGSPGDAGQVGGGGVARPREAAAVGGCPWARTGLGAEPKDAVCPWANSLPSLSLTLLFWERE